MSDIQHVKALVLFALSVWFLCKSAILPDMSLITAKKCFILSPY